MRAVTRLAALVTSGALLMAVAACGGDDDGDGGAADGEGDGQTTTTAADEGSTETTAAPEPQPALEELSLELTEIAQLDQPIAIATRPDDDATMLVAEKPGRVQRLEVSGEGTERTYRPADEPLLDLTDEVQDAGFEQGLLDIELSPDGQRLYVSYSLAPNGDTRIEVYDYQADAPGGPRVDPASRREILTLEQPYENHNGGGIVFGPDGFLYVGLGDGGDGGDPHDNGQNPDTLLGTLLRIDPESTAESGDPYAIPEDNPFADGQGGRPEVWLYGARNPWRFSFDAVTGDLWIGDVGQNAWEEVDRLPAADGADAGRGANLGWNLMEGSHPFEGGSNPEGGVLPISEYPIGGEEAACAVTGGYVYSGRAIPELDAVYLFGDFCDPAVRTLSLRDGELVGETILPDIEVPGLVSFGEDNQGELYLLSMEGPIYRLDP